MIFPQKISCSRTTQLYLVANYPRILEVGLYHFRSIVHPLGQAGLIHESKKKGELS